MKKLIALMTTAVLAASFTTSCQLMHHPYDEDNARKLAIEYMKEKYDKEIEVTDTYCQKHGSDKYVGVNFKLDETDNESSDDSTYEVRVYGNKDTQYQYVKCDNFMNTLFEPYLYDQINAFFIKNNITIFDFWVDRERQLSAGGIGYYMFDLDIPDNSICLNDYLDRFDLSFDIIVRVPKMEADTKGGTEETINAIASKMEEHIDDDWIHLYMQFYSDNEFEKGKEIGYKGINVYHNEGASPYAEKDIYLKRNGIKE